MWPVCVTSPHGQPHTIFRGFISVSGGWMLLCKELFMTLCSACGHFSIALVILLASVCCGTALTKAEESV